MAGIFIKNFLSSILNCIWEDKHLTFLPLISRWRAGFHFWPMRMYFWDITVNAWILYADKSQSIAVIFFFSDILIVIESVRTFPDDYLRWEFKVFTKLERSLISSDIFLYPVLWKSNYGCFRQMGIESSLNFFSISVFFRIIATAVFSGSSLFASIVFKLLIIPSSILVTGVVVIVFF